MKKSLLASVVLSLSAFGFAQAQSVGAAFVQVEQGYAAAQPQIEEQHSATSSNKRMHRGSAKQHSVTQSIMLDRLDNLSALLEKEWDFRDGLDLRIAQSDKRLAMLMQEQTEITNTLNTIKSLKHKPHARVKHYENGLAENPSQENQLETAAKAQFEKWVDVHKSYMNAFKQKADSQSIENVTQQFDLDSVGNLKRLSPAELKAYMVEKEAEFRAFFEAKRAEVEKSVSQQESLDKRMLSNLTQAEFEELKQARDQFKDQVQVVKDKVKERLSVTKPQESELREPIGEIIQLQGLSIQQN